MADNASQKYILSLLKAQHKPISLREIQQLSTIECAERTLRRWLSTWADEGQILITGQKRSTRYRYNNPYDKQPTFLTLIPEKNRAPLLKQLRDLWTHNSTAIEGNTLSLGDTHFILEQGLTISGKPLREHQEIVGHAKAIQILYEGINTALNENLIFELHKAVQTEYISDIYKPYGAWKIEPNGTYVVTRENKQEFIEYALPPHTPHLMAELIKYMESLDQLSAYSAAKHYAHIHAAFVHIHPFFDGQWTLGTPVGEPAIIKMWAAAAAY